MLASTWICKALVLLTSSKSSAGTRIRCARDCWDMDSDRFSARTLLVLMHFSVLAVYLVEEAWPPNAWWLQRIYLWDLSIPQQLMSSAGVDRSRTSNISSKNNGVSGPVCSCNRAAEAAILVCTRRARVQVLVRLVPIVFARHTRSSSIVFRVLVAQRVPCACSRRSVSVASTRQMAVL